MSTLCPLPQEEEKGLRVIKLLDEATNVLKEYLLRSYTSTTLSFEDDLRNHKKTLKTILATGQCKIVFPTTGNTNPGEYDISVLQVLVRVLKKLQRPKTGWTFKPLPTDQSDSAHVVRICFNRNKVLHSRLKTTNHEYNSFIQDMFQAIPGLGGDVNKINKILKQPIDSNVFALLQAEKQDLLASEQKVTDLEEKLAEFESISKKNVRFGLNALVPSFTGRDVEVNDIKKLLETDQGSKEAIVLTGLPGTGKTSLALYYCYKYDQSYNNVVWLNANGTESLKESFANLLVTLNILKDDEAGNMNLEVLASKTYNNFHEHDTLYVFDNADEKSFLLNLLPVNAKATVLVTSRTSLWGQRFHEKKITTLSETDAAELIRNNLPLDLITDDANLKALYTLLHGYPLALQQSVAYMKYAAVSIGDYLEIFKSTEDERLLKFPSDDLMYQNNLFGSVLLILSSLQSNEKAFKLLKFISFMDGLNINKSILDQLNYTRWELDDALMALELLSLIQIHRNYAKKECNITIHSLVQLIVRRKLSDADHESHLTQILSAVDKIIAGKKNYNHIDFGKPWLPHILHLCDILEENTTFQGYLAKCKYQICSALKTSGNDETALVILKTVKKYYLQTIGQTSQELFDTIRLIVLTYIDLSHWLSALKCCYEMKDIAEKIEQLEIENQLNVDNRVIRQNKVENQISVQHHIAFCFSKLGRNAEALAIYTKLHEIEVNYIGAFDPTTLVTEGNIAMELQYLSKYEEALQIIDRTLEKYRKVPGYLEVTGYYVAGGCRVSFLINLNRYREAEAAIISLLQESRDALGENHLRTLDIESRYAAILKNCGKYEQSLELLLNIEKRQNDLYQADHPMLIKTQSLLGKSLLSLGRFSEALAIFQKLLQVLLRLFGEEHSDVRQVKRDIIDCFYIMGSYKQALSLGYDLFEQEKDIPDSVYFYSTANRVGNCLLQLGRFHESLETYKIPRRSETSSVDQINVAICSHGMGKLKEALSILKSLTNNQIASYSLNGQAVVQYRIAACLIDLGFYTEGIDILQEILKSNLMIGSNNLYKLRTYSQLAKAYQKLGRYTESKASSKFVSDHGNELNDWHLLKITSVIAQAKCYSEEGIPDIENLQTMLQKAQEELNSTHPECLQIEVTIAEGKIQNGEISEALTILKKVCLIQTENLGESHPHALQTRYLIAKYSDEIGKEKVNKLKEVHRQQTEVIGEFHLDTLKTYREIALCIPDSREAVNILDAVMRKLSELLGPDHNEVRVTEKLQESVKNSQSKSICTVM